MESIPVWTLIIAAIAIISMLALLIASEREVKRKSIELESLQEKLEQADLVVEGGPNLALAEATEVSAEVALLTEQVRSNEVIIATMQCELEALRAENSWLKQESAGYQSKSSDLQTHMTESMPTSQVERSSARVIDYPLDLGPSKSRLVFPVTAFALLLVALVSVHFARDWQKTAVTSIHRAASPSHDQRNESRAVDTLNTAD
ncbi:MAG: hypothetical protein ACREQV_01350, partial [Candidatus Binatia bacterium]